MDNSNPKGLRGPDGQLQIPLWLPLEAEAAMDKDIICPGFAALDGTPGRIYTLGNDTWRLETHEWLKTHASKLLSRRYEWVDAAIKLSHPVTGEKSGNKMVVNYAALASQDEKRAVEKLDKRLAKKKDEARTKRMLDEWKKRDGIEPLDWICMCRPM